MAVAQINEKISGQSASSDIPTKTFDVIVLGAGISGLVAASVLAQDEGLQVLVLDEYDDAGGNHKNFDMNGYHFDVGSLIFQDDSPLLKHFPELLPLYIEIDPSWARLNPQGRVTQYPFSLRDDFFRAGPWEWCRVVASLVRSRLTKRDLRNARDYANFWIGSRLAERSGLVNYMRRFYGLTPEKIDLDFARKRMGWLEEQASMTFPFKRLLQRRKKPKASNRQLARPREGFRFLYSQAIARLERRGVRLALGQSMSQIEKHGDTLSVNVGSRCFRARRVVSTIPLERVHNLCDLDFDARLQSVTLISLFCSFSGNRGFLESILYNFSDKGAWKRLTMYSDFYGLNKGREYFGVEVNADLVESRIDLAFEDFQNHCYSNKIFVGELKLEGSNTMFNAYPIYTNQASKRAASAIEKLRSFGIESFGRQGGFDYQPTARVSTIEAETKVRR